MDMVDYQAVRNFLDTHSLSYFTFYLKADKPIKAVTRHLPINTPAEDIGIDVFSVRQMSTTRRSPDGSTNITLSLFLVTLPKNTKSPELFKLSSRCHISIKAEAYKSRNTLTQCYNCQKFGHVGQLQTAFPLHVVWGLPPAQRLPGEGEHIFDS
jgi:hypothetical protein